ncbi:hypothetical protein [Pseudorhodobacter wandonensis]|uniref:hypothetical protein n=1 Tax=Pseudorhodobacter wandonensis TaxID=1120568 RepID=UPI00067DE1FF|nr:hypothetical protein [Pseudorhodobacter wandonensis]
MNSTLTTSKVAAEYKRNTAHVYDISFKYPDEAYEGLDLGNDADWLRSNPKRLGRVWLFAERNFGKPILILSFRVADPDAPGGWILGHHIADPGSRLKREAFTHIPAFTAWKRNPSPDIEDTLIYETLWRDAKRVGGAVETQARFLLLPVSE